MSACIAQGFNVSTCEQTMTNMRSSIEGWIDTPILCTISFFIHELKYVPQFLFRSCADTLFVGRAILWHRAGFIQISY